MVTKCSTCREEYSPACDWRQGRCPHIPAVLKLTFINRLINYFKGNNEQSSRSSKTQKHKSRKKRD